ncbi:hypothetical protein MSP7336_01801 [Mycobacterium shimoidei]|uniref:Tail terminator n=1 Tax=Mycobacterium shimoidei TaxID=29313 RepID=A0A375YXK6_MYCSH|nr:hypothetical protein [Mycobacterium shimoidei]SRX93562.1 hypothetical protein MSP7336_01801 [Mycobacterium shimoidei]
MTVELYDLEAPDLEDFTACWLQPLVRASTDHNVNDGFPFVLVQRITGSEYPDCGMADEIVQLDIMDNDPQSASRLHRKVHRRMLYLARYAVDVEMSDGSIANADYVRPTLLPQRMDYTNDLIIRYVARYQMGLSYVAAT